MNTFIVVLFIMLFGCQVAKAQTSTNTITVLPPSFITDTSFTASTPQRQRCCPVALNFSGAVLDVATDSSFSEASYLLPYRRFAFKDYPPEDTVSVTVRNLNPATTYYYRFARIDTMGNVKGFSSVRSVTTVSSLLPRVPNVSVLNITDRSFTLSWDKDSTAQRFYVTIWVSPLRGIDELDTYIVRRQIVTQNVFTAENLPREPNTGFTFSVESENMFGKRSYWCFPCEEGSVRGVRLTRDSNLTAKFVTDMIPYSKLPLSSIGKDPRFVFAYLDENGGLPNLGALNLVDTVWVNKTPDDNTTGLWHLNEGQVGVSLRYIIGFPTIVHLKRAADDAELKAAGIYRRTLASYDLSPASPIYYRYSLKTPTSVSRTTFESLRAELSPNPASEAATLSFSLPAPSHVRLTLHDALGREVVRVPEQVYGAGGHEVSLSVRDLSPGTYFLRCSVGGQVVVQRVVVMR
jgi:hypothetical protein